MDLAGRQFKTCQMTIHDMLNLKRLMVFMTSLQDLILKFDTVCGRIFEQRPLPSLMEVCFEVRLEEDCTNAVGVLTTPTIDFVAFSAWSLDHGSDKNNGKPIPVCKKRSSNEKHISRCAYISETTFASTCQSIGPIARQTKTPTLGAIAQSSMPQFLGLISIDDMSSGRTIDTARHSRGLYILDDDTSCSSFSRASLLSSYFNTSEQYCIDVWGPSKVTTSSGKRWAVTFINNHTRLTRVYLITDKLENTFSYPPPQTPLDCLKESYPSTRLVSEVPLRVFVRYPLHQCSCKCFHPSSMKYFVTMDVTFYEDPPYIPVSHLQGESVSEESNNTFEFIEPTLSIVFDVDPHPIILPTNQVPWKTYYRRNLRKEVESAADFSPRLRTFLRSRSDVAILENVEEKNCGDETEVITKTSNNEAEQGHIGKLDEYDPSLDIPIALRKELQIYTALQCPKWKNVVMEEMKTLEKNRTWEICVLLKGHKTLDVKNAFLNGDLVEEVYMSPLLGFEAQFGQQDCKLQKSLYGLKQSSRAWFDRFTIFVKTQGYSQGHSDHTSFTKVSKTGKIAVLIVYVDDIVLTVDDQTKISQLKQRMSDEFEIKDLGNLKYFLGMEVVKSKEGIFILRENTPLIC
ncbi:Cysteine-rich RLK (RECEPTOR-like protein kinase) 8 [Cucumis melo var. makuwa]|uniref:Cysteine-rich RLK (RECEPTOR-like protein kinase) 8 n=1 Tax=Cucumis melo var. makuwa TaxID=1194695 RepID=A0A5A7SIF6_CUCMM|nr:Cysteine-rich RLK (RECEPTOR-like protein kinase) 8 [Cucumis melo var. makuwa]